MLRSKASTCDDLVTLVEAQRGIAVLRGLEGDHRAALRDLERLMPLAHLIGKRGHPSYFAFLNSYALELSESGKPDEAERVADAVAASPFINQYREWRETIVEIEAKRKRSSTIAVSYPTLALAAIRDLRVRAAIHFMKANIHRALNLGKIASAVNLSPTHISHLFKIEAGIPPGEYLIRLRMQAAQKLLATSLLSVKEVMAAVGYNNRTSFLRQFRRYSNTTPTAYRIRAQIQR